VHYENEHRETYVNAAPTRAIVSAEPQRLARGRRGVQGGDQGAPDQPRCGGEWEYHGGGRWQG